MFIFDLHLHSKYSSDGILDPKTITKVAIRRGLNGIAITDHNTIKGGLKAKEYETKNFKVIIGSEIMTNNGEVIGLFLSEEIRSTDLIEVISTIKAQNGIVVIPHPFDKMRHSALYPTDEEAHLIDCIEGFNSRCIFQKYNDKAVEYANKHNLPLVAGSDAHFANEIGNAGIVTQSEDLQDAIIKNNIEIFGSRSMLINHAFTKGLKRWRKIRYG
ncbi:PHP domain-containing protein [Methanosarcina barkeri]|uniref:Polymerase/histidinol phosphatase N-terminal domain-containing protein n=1 Tax=Methanosarcina barkeri (strain Fusaro / DSM 804) TaxID=269797 RepID=Q46CL9_METBF|nr:PHP domain-containing protein [Methanosarcina barkeri]